MQSRIGIAVALLATAVVATPLWLSRNPPVEVTVAMATRAPLRIIVATNATVEPIDDFEVRARLDARVLEIRPAGSRVAAATVLARLDANPVAAELNATQAQLLEADESLRIARASRDRAQRSFTLDERLHRGNALAADRLQESRADLDEAEARLAFLEREVPVRSAALRLRIDDLNARLAGTEITAPFAGIVYRTEAEIGAVVRHGEHLLSLADLERLQLRANIDQVDLGKVGAGNPVEIAANAFPDRLWHGRITEIIPHVELRRNRAVAEAIAEIVAPTDGLVPGMNVDIEIVVHQEADVLQVPSRAIFTGAAGPIVYRVDDDRITAVPVRLGLSSFTAVEVVAGLDVGSEVVLGPAPALRDGLRVVPHRE